MPFKQVKGGDQDSMTNIMPCRLIDGSYLI